MELEVRQRVAKLVAREWAAGVADPEAQRRGARQGLPPVAPEEVAEVGGLEASQR
jgi:hypothetical protein